MGVLLARPDQVARPRVQHLDQAIAPARCDAGPVGQSREKVDGSYVSRMCTASALTFPYLDRVVVVPRDDPRSAQGKAIVLA